MRSKKEPPFVRPHLTILSIGNRLVPRQVLWYASRGTWGAARRLSPSAAKRTAAPLVLVRIVQRFVQPRGLSILGRMEKGVLVPISCKFLLGKQVSPRLESVRWD